MPGGLTIDYETADRITILTLQEQLQSIKEDLRKHLEEGKYMHPEDMSNAYVHIPQLESIIKYFSVSV
jgi:coproporphyrinogen III oxidase-like Fe-S oxidoreductase